MTPMYRSGETDEGSGRNRTEEILAGASADIAAESPGAGCCWGLGCRGRFFRSRAASSAALSRSSRTLGDDGG